MEHESNNDTIATAVADLSEKVSKMMALLGDYITKNDERVEKMGNMVMTQSKRATERDDMATRNDTRGITTPNPQVAGQAGAESPVRMPHGYVANPMREDWQRAKREAQQMIAEGRFGGNPEAFANGKIRQNIKAGRYNNLEGLPLQQKLQLTPMAKKADASFSY